MVTIYSERMKALIENHAIKEVKVFINKFFYINSEVVLSPSLEVRGMKPNSPAIHQLLIGDRIVEINGRSVTEPTEVLLFIHNAPKKVDGNDGGFNDYQIELSVCRQANKSPVNRLRLAYAFRQSPRNFLHPPGNHYFVVTLRRIRGIHLGFKVKENHGRIKITEIFPNTIASYNFLVGDTLLDVNCEPVNSIPRMRDVLRKSMHRYGICTTLMERQVPESFERRPANLDAVMAKDVVTIGEREAYKFMACQDRHFLKPVLTSGETAVTAGSAEKKQRDQKKVIKTFDVARHRRKILDKSIEAKTAKDVELKKTTKQALKTVATKKQLFAKSPLEQLFSLDEDEFEEKTVNDFVQKSGVRKLREERAKHENTAVGGSGGKARDKHDGGGTKLRTALDKREVNDAAGEKEDLRDNNNNNATQTQKESRLKKKSKRHTIISPRHGEHIIQTDVKDPTLLHKVAKHQQNAAKKKKRRNTSNDSRSL